MPKLLERLVVEVHHFEGPHYRYYLDGKRVTYRAYRHASAECSTFDSFQNTSGKTRTGVPLTRYHSTGRLSA